MSRVSLKIHLIKEPFSNSEMCIRENELPSLDSQAIDIQGASYSCLYLRKNKPKRPDWRALFPGINWSKYQTNTFSGLLIIDVSGRRFAITAGSGRFLLDPFAIEESFGFKTVINSVDPSTIRKIEKKTINQNPISSIEQLTHTSGLHDFQVDYYTDIVSKIRAKSSISELGTIIDGRDSLQISVECNVDAISDALSTCLEAYGSDAYLEYFPNIDNISVVGDRELTDVLDQMLIQRLNAGDFTNCWASMPEIIQDDNFDVFQFSRRQNALRYHDIELNNCLEKYTSKNRSFTKSELERDEVYIRTHGGDNYPRWRVWKCIYAEIIHTNQLYVLIDGKWYRVSQDFIQRLEEQIAEIPRAQFDLPSWKQQDKEPNYLASVSDGFLVLDRDLVRVEGQSPIEFCDLFLPDRTFIHVKRYGSSEVLSHLFNQGRVAARLLLEDRRFREEARKKFGDVAPFEIEERPDPRLFTIAFLVGSKYGDDQPLPLFARVVLVDVFNELRNYGFNVMLGFIKIELM
jgi:uncharacterized protein (TIGR04141 family)